MKCSLSRELHYKNALKEAALILKPFRPMLAKAMMEASM